MQDAIDGFLVAPLWAQVAMAFFAFTFIVMLVSSPLHRRKMRRQFDNLAGELGQQPPSGRGWPVAFPVSLDGRTFLIRYDVRNRSRNAPQRGPTGHLLIAATRLAGTTWEMHNIDMTPVRGFLARFASAARATGDAHFDERVMVTEDGVPVRAGWLDEATRAAIARFFDGLALSGVIWVREGELQFVTADPWTGVDGPAIRALLQRQAVLASALERTAAARGRP